MEYDPATTEHKAKEFGVNSYDTIETNGLETDWTQYNRVWVNPPFSRKKEFMTKAVKSVELKPDMTIFVLVPIETLTTKWFGETVSNYDLHVPNGRIKFEDPKNPSAKSPAFGSVVVELGKNVSGNILKVDLDNK